MSFADLAEGAVRRARVSSPSRTGSLARVVGLTIEVRGLMAPLGAVCEVVGNNGHRLEAEVVGFQDQVLYLMPFVEPKGIGPGDMVRVIEHTAQARLGPELLGRVIGPRGEALDGRPDPLRLGSRARAGVGLAGVGGDPGVAPRRRRDR